MALKGIPYGPVMVLIGHGEPFSCIDIQLKAENFTSIAKSASGIFEKIRSLGAEIIEVKENFEFDGEVAKSFMLIAIDRDTIKASEIAKELEKLDGIVHSSTAEKFRNVCYSSQLFPINVFGLRWILLGPANMEAILLGAKKILGSQVFPYYHRSIGTTIGKNLYEYYLKGSVPMESLDDALKFLNMILILSGWGFMEKWSVGESGIEVTIRDLWEMQILLSKQAEDPPRMSLGIFEGFFGSLLRREVNANLLSIEKENRSIATRILVRF